MKFVRFNEDRLGLLTADEGIIDVTERAGLDSEEPLIELMESKTDVSAYGDDEPDYELDEVRLEAPVNRPGKIVAAPLNYENHIEESITDEDITLEEWFSIKERGYFLKAPSSIIGPDDDIVLPFNDRRVDHEVELAFVIGEETKDVSADEAWDKIFGYTMLLDISVRGDQDRSSRKSYDTFTVVGPMVVTEDDIGDPQNLDLHLSVNGETRQEDNTKDMVYTCADIVQYASIGATLEPGDIVTTGTPEGVGPIEDGDTVNATVENVGSMTIDVRGRDVAFDDVDVQKQGQQ